MAPAGRRAAVLAAGCAVVLAVALTMSSSSAASEPSVESMYHMCCLLYTSDAADE